MLMGVLRLAAEGGAGPVGGEASRAVTFAALTALNTLAARGDRCPLSSRCAARMTQCTQLCLPVAAPPAVVSISSVSAPVFSSAAAADATAVKSVFAPACALLAALLRSRRVELKRSAALITASCAALLDAMRSWNQHYHQSIVAAGMAGSTNTVGAPQQQQSHAAATAAAAEAHNAAMRSAATALVPVYEEANSTGLGRYCAHLLADAVTASCGGLGEGGGGSGGGGAAFGGGPGIGPAAEKALRPGVFALLDACGDRELQQLHGALGSLAGGARRVVLSALIDEHRRSHKYDGKV